MADNHQFKTDSSSAVASVERLKDAYTALFKELTLVKSELQKIFAKNNLNPNKGPIGLADDPKTKVFIRQLSQINKQVSTINRAVNLAEQSQKRQAASVQQMLRDQQKFATLQARLASTNPGSIQEATLRRKIKELEIEREIATTRKAESATLARQRQELAELIGLEARLKRQAQETAVAQKNAGFAGNQARVQGAASTGLAVANERVRGSGAAQTFGLQTALTANFFVVTQLTSALRYVVGFVVEFDKALHNLQAITAASDGTMKGFRDTIEEVANVTKFTSVEVANAAQILGQAGFSAKEVQQSLGAVAEFASAVGVDITKAVDIITSALSVFNLRAAEAANVADIFTAAINKSKLTSDKLAISFTYVANAAAQSGASISELTTLLAALANAGLRSGSTIGTNLRSLLRELNSPSEKLLETLKALGLTINDVDIRANGIIGVIQKLKAAGFGASEAFGAFRTRTAAAFLALSAQADTLDTLQSQLVGTGAAARASDKQMESLANTLANFQSVIGTLSLKALEPTVRSLQSIFESVNELGQALNANSGATFLIQAFGTALTVAATAAGAKFLARIFGITGGVKGMGVGLKRATAELQVIGRQMERNAAESVGFSVAMNRTAGSLLKTEVAAGAVTGSLRGLGIVFRAMGGWVGVAITALTLMPVIMDKITGSSRNLAKQLDDAKTQVEKTSAAYLDSQTVIQGLEHDLQGLREQQTHLTSNSEALKAKVTDLVDSYGELGLGLDEQNTKYPEVVQKVRELRDAYLEQAAAAAHANEASLKALQIAQEGALNGTSVSDLLTGNQSSLAKLLGAKGSTFTKGGTFQTEANFNNAGSVANALFSRGLVNTSSVFSAVNQGKLASLSPTTTDAAINELSRTFSKDGETPKAIRDLIEQLRTVGEDLRNLKSTVEDQNKANSASFVARAQRYSPGIAIATGTAEYLSNQLNKAVESTQGSNDFLYDPRSAEASLRASGEAIKDKLKDLQKGAIEAVNTDAEKKALEQTFNSLIAEAVSNYETTLQKLHDKALEESSTLLGYSVREQQNYIQQAIEGLKQTRNQDELEVQKKKIDQAIDNYAIAKLKQVAVGLGLTESQFTISGGKVVPTSRDFTKSEEATLTSAYREIDSLRSSRQENSKTQSEKIKQDSIAQQIKSNSKLISALSQQLGIGTSNLEAGTFGRDSLRRVHEQQLDLIEKINKLEAENLDLEIKKSRNLSPEDIKSKRSALDQKQADRLSGVQSDYRDQYLDLPATNFKEAGQDLIHQLVPNEFEKNSISAANTFKESMLAAVDATKAGFTDFFTTVLSGQKSVGAGFKDLAISILQSMQQVIASKLAEAFVNLLVKVAASAFGGSSGLTGSNNLAVAGIGVNSGGLIKATSRDRIKGMAAGGVVNTRDSVMRFLQPDEYVLRKSAVDAIGVDNLDQINAQGNRAISRTPPVPYRQPAPAAPVNVWVVSPDQKPPMGPRDVVATISEDIMRGGQIKKLIKTVYHGQF